VSGVKEGGTKHLTLARLETGRLYICREEFLAMRRHSLDSFTSWQLRFLLYPVFPSSSHVSEGAHCFRWRIGTAKMGVNRSAHLLRVFQQAAAVDAPLRLPRNLTKHNHLQQFSSTRTTKLSNRVYDPIRIPPTFHDYLRVASASNVLLLALFSTSACPSCRHITPLLTDLVNHRSPNPQDKFSALSFAEVELDSPDTSNGNMMDLGVEWGIMSMPTLIGFGGRRAERVTDRVTDTSFMKDQARMREWVDEVMRKGDPSGTSGSTGGGLIKSLFG
jgi:thiol-disulfide isomerase/thioredoxin